MSIGITSSVTFHKVAGCNVYCLPTRSEGVVAIAGSFRTPPRTGVFDDVVKDLLVGMLDKGTESADRFEISELLDRSGVEREYMPTEDRVMFRGRSVSDSVGTLFDVVFDELTSPRLEAEQLDALKSRYDSAVLRSTESTGVMAASQLSRMLYDPHHPNYDFLPSVRRSAYADTELDDVVDYHHSINTVDDLTIVIVGTFDRKKTLAYLKQRIERLPAGKATSDVEATISGYQSETLGRLHVFPMRDKQNLDVVMGIPTPLLRTNPRYLPLHVGNFVLGGNFSSRLMQIIRDEMGLTYGIRSALNGITTKHSGHWQLSVTLSTEVLKQGLDAVNVVVEEFCARGAELAEVQNKKTTIRGNYSTHVSTTSALAGSILQGVQTGFGPHYPDIYREQIDAVTVDQVNDAITGYLAGKSVAISIAGSIESANAEALLPSK